MPYTTLLRSLQLGTTASHEFCLDAVTQNAARAIGITNYGIAPGCVADLVILDAKSASEAIATASPSRTVLKAGKVVAQTKLQQTIGV
ncbi:MAG: amidohydrolase family protein, partial [Leptolyngbya sp. SIO1D8]|nr:amidohydrolase family protein [Leptolyngbya sp. SIO1D8]